VSVRLAVLASGGGSNLQALLDRFAYDDTARIALVVSDVADAGALERGRAAGVRAEHIAIRDRSPDVVAHDMLRLLEEEGVELIALAGYLQLVPPAVTERFRNSIVNIHPALLPAFGGPGMYGMRVHRAVLEAGCTVTGATVHRVNERYDEGSIIAQWPVPVINGDTPETLAARVLRTEHVLYPAVIAYLAQSMSAGNEWFGYSPIESFSPGGDVPDIEPYIPTVVRW
jgi:phosphoribosylglycinamide formyltransferase-1